MKTKLKPIRGIAKALGLKNNEIFNCGEYMAKVSLKTLERLKKKKNGKYIIVTSITPTPLGEGKTVNTIGLAMALNKKGKKASACIRQSSLGPLFGVKGGGTGGGQSQVIPEEEAKLHLTGDTHAVSAAHNLCAAFLDNSIFHKNILQIDRSSVKWKRAMDVSDRFLRELKFEITSASEVMAILALTTSLSDLRRRIGRIILATDSKGNSVTAEDIKVAGAMTALLKDALKPNILQTTENTPCFIHAGPFANIAHGNSSILADKIALKLSDYVVTESGFGADSGAEKFINIKCRISGMKPDVVVIVSTVRALKVHSGRYAVAPGRPLDPGLFREDIDALETGCANLEKHIENMRLFGIPVVVAVNRFASDTKKEIEIIRKKAFGAGAEEAVISEAWQSGSKGARRLAEAVSRAADKKSKLKFLYPLSIPIREKIETIATNIYGAMNVSYEPLAENAIDLYTNLGYDKLPVCMAKTQFSLSHDPALKGRPEGFVLPVKDVHLAAGAGFLYALCGNINTMPGLPTHPIGEKVDIDSNGKIVGLS